VVFKGHRTLPKPEIPDLRDRIYTKSAVAKANAITKNEKNYDKRYDQKRDGANWRSSDLINSGSKIYRQNINHYRIEKTAYKAQRSNLDKLQKFIFSIVNPIYTKSCYILTHTFQQWYDNLRNRCGRTDATEKQEAGYEYKKMP
jgi:hypothetical protein